MVQHFFIAQPHVLLDRVLSGDVALFLQYISHGSIQLSLFFLTV